MLQIVIAGNGKSFKVVGFELIVIIIGDVIHFIQTFDMKYKDVASTKTKANVKNNLTGKKNSKIIVFKIENHFVTI